MGAEIDFWHPDIVFNKNKIVYEETRIGYTLVVIQDEAGAKALIKVNAIRQNQSHIWNRFYLAWMCTHLTRFGKVCAYYPGHEEMPPIPNQKCYNCGNPRAVWF